MPTICPKCGYSHLSSDPCIFSSQKLGMPEKTTYDFKKNQYQIMVDWLISCKYIKTMSYQDFLNIQELIDKKL